MLMKLMTDEMKTKIAALPPEAKVVAAEMFPDHTADEQAIAFATLSEERQRIELGKPRATPASTTKPPPEAKTTEEK